MRSRKIVTAIGLLAMLLPALAQNLPCQTYGGTMNERAHALVQNFSDASYVMAGFTTMPMDTNLLIVKIDSTGDTLKAKISYGNKTEFATSMIKTSDNGYALTGWTTTYQ
ncbi:MAG: hypothetical protein N2748_03715, partial [candidate division WOR-3 bacterium]|nr:hypothetical protein [candidate division WOR-3 bacterium]